MRRDWVTFGGKLASFWSSTNNFFMLSWSDLNWRKNTVNSQETRLQLLAFNTDSFLLQHLPNELLQSAHFLVFLSIIKVEFLEFFGKIGIFSTGCGQFILEVVAVFLQLFVDSRQLLWCATVFLQNGKFTKLIKISRSISRRGKHCIRIMQ